MVLNLENVEVTSLRWHCQCLCAIIGGSDEFDALLLVLQVGCKGNKQLLLVTPQIIHGHDHFFLTP